MKKKKETPRIILKRNIAILEDTVYTYNKTGRMHFMGSKLIDSFKDLLSFREFLKRKTKIKNEHKQTLYDIYIQYKTNNLKFL